MTKHLIGKKATVRQLNYIDILLGEIHIQGEEVPDDIKDQLNQTSLLFAEASNIIDDLKELLGWEE